MVADKENPFPRRRITPTRDGHGAHWSIAAEPTKYGRGDGDPNRRVTFPQIEVWWSREKALKDECIVIRQGDDAADHLDVVVLTLGQVYDLIDVMNQAVEST